MANSSSGKRGKDAGRNTGKDPAREAIETSLLSFSKEVYRTLDTKQAEIQRLTEKLERLTTSKATLQTISNRLAHTIESLAKSEEQLKVVNDLLLEANEARKAVDEARKSAEDSKKDALSQRDWFKSELDRIRIEWSAKSSESQTLLDQARVELKDIKFQFNNVKAESKEACNELEAIRLEKDTARNERDQAVKMLHQTQLETEEWKREYEKREGEACILLHIYIAYWKDQAKKWHAFVVDSTHRQSKKIKSESAIAAVAPLTPASASGYSSRRRAVDDEEQSEEIGDEDDTDPDSPIDSQCRRNSVATALGNTTTHRRGAGVNTFNVTGIEGKFQTPKTLTRTPKTVKPSTSALTSTVRTKAATSTSSAHPSSSSKPAPSRNDIPSSSRARRRDEVGTSHDNRGRQKNEDHDVHSRDLNDPEDSQGQYERDKSLSSLVYPADPDRVLPIPPRTPQNPRIPRIPSHDDRITHPVIAPTSSTSKAKAPPRSVIHSRLIRPVREYQFVVDIKEEDDEPGVISGSSGGKVNGSVHHTSNREVFEDVYDGEIEDDELEEPSGDDTQPTPTRERAKRKGKARATERVPEPRSQSAWNLFDDEQVEGGVGVEAETAPVVGSSTDVGSSSKRRGRECLKKTGRVKSRGKSDVGSSRSHSRPKPKSKHVDRDNDSDGENDPYSEHGEDYDNKVEYHRPIQRTRHRANPSRLSSPSLASSEDELMITSNGVGGGDSPKTTRTGASRTLHHDSYTSHPSSSKKRPPTPLTSSTSDGGTASRKRRKR
ncbi:hypothetical protein EV368DRAFT_79125 [Lentinula lateritia]|nr:hypothetical protein EV368DRAFT_79125 [Lentinula lateritia]